MKRIMKRPICPLIEFDQACEMAELSEEEQKLIDFIRFKGIFTQPLITKELGLKSKPPVLSVICQICRKIGNQIPDHFNKVRKWSKEKNKYNVQWDGELVCSSVWNIDGEELSPENGTAQFHIFAVHKELFQGLD